MPDLAIVFGADVSARTDIIETETGPEPYIDGDLQVEDEFLNNLLLPSAISPNLLHFSAYYDEAIEQILTDVDTSIVLSNMETSIIHAFESLEQKKDERNSLEVILPSPVPIIEVDSFQLNFAAPVIAGEFMPNRSDWQRTIETFVENEPGLVGINLINELPLLPDAHNYDCFYRPFHTAVYPYEGLVLNLDPLMQSDGTFHEADVVPTVLDALDSNGNVWAYPIHIYPATMFYNSSRLQNLDIMTPEIDWSIDDFEALLSGQSRTNNEPALVLSGSYAPTYIQMLVSAYGGHTIDYSVNPPEIRFTEPETVQIIDQLLERIKDGEIVIDSVTTAGTLSPLVIADVYLFEGGYTLYTPEGYERLLPPRSEQSIPLSYNIGVGYISATTLYPETCYRWLQTISRNPTLFFGLPAFETVRELPTMTATRDASELEFLNIFYAALDEPNSVIFPFPASLNGSRNDLYNYSVIWFYLALQNVLANDADLQRELELASDRINGYQQCMESVPAPNVISATIDDEVRRELAGRSIECAIQIDPEFYSRRGFNVNSDSSEE